MERRGKCDTYYVYNKLGQLTYVLSPKYQMTKDLAGLAYQYEYDNYNNVIKKYYLERNIPNIGTIKKINFLFYKMQI